MTQSFDLIVIGSGQAGPFLAAKLANRGERVALIEERDLGGTCVNRGCTPTKTLRKSARVAHIVGRAAEFGVNVGDVSIDFKTAMRRMTEHVQGSRRGLESWLGGLDNLDVIKERGRLAGREGDQFVVDAGNRRLKSPRVVLNTGTRPAVPSIPGLPDVEYLDNDSILQLNELPERLLILGGSYIGLELGQIFRRLGSDVTVLQRGPRIVSREDADIAETLTELLCAEGLRIEVGASVIGVSTVDVSGGVRAELSDGQSIEASHLLVATGRTRNTDDLGLETVGVQTDARGNVPTNDLLETAVDGIWALGDINGRGAFTHTSYHDHEILAANLEGGARSAADRIMTYAMFTDPPLGHVGLYEKDARRLIAEEGRSISQAAFPMNRVSRAKEESEVGGLIKLLIDEDSGHFLGASMLGINADEIIQVIGQLMAAGATWESVRHALPVHPTVTEFLPTILDQRVPL